MTSSECLHHHAFESIVMKYSKNLLVANDDKMPFPHITQTEGTVLIGMEAVGLRTLSGFEEDPVRTV